MAEGSTSENALLEEARKPDLERKLSAIGWGAFFAWMGIVLLTGLGTGTVLLGIGLITLGIQGARRYFNLDLEKFWIVCGAIFLAGGLWDLTEWDLPLVPIVLFLVGIVLVVNAFRRK